MIYVVEEKPNPSSDFFVLPELEHWAGPVRRMGFSSVPAPEQLDGAWVILVRYVPPRWRRVLTAAGDRLAGLVLFMDDDLLDPRASLGLPWRYRMKLWRLGARHATWLERMGGQLWVSTPHLRDKYAHRGPRLIPPRPLPGPLACRRVFYHGSAAHGAEIRWMYPVMEAVLQQEDRVHFEIIGGRDVKRLYRGLPRVTVVHPMDWATYQAFSAFPGRHIGLVPQLDQPFNAARSHTKIFDIARAQAVGIYAEGSDCARWITHGRDGWIASMAQEPWVEAILTLARDDGLWASLQTGTRTLVGRMAAARGPSECHPA